METTAKILIIDDDVVIRHFLKSALVRQRYELLEAANGQDGLSLAAKLSPDVVLLDLGLPDMDGIEVASRLRGWTQSPIIVLSSREQEKSKVAALDAGADDYVTKPIGVAELQARVRVALRHARSNPQNQSEPLYDVNGLRVDAIHRQVFLNDVEIRLTPIEYKLLAHLVKNAGKVVRHRELLQSVWGPEYDTETNYLRIYIKHLRNKIEADSSQPRFILNEPGIGYRLSAD